MSYQTKVIQDYPIAFWPLDEINFPTFSVASYNDSKSIYNEESAYNSDGFPLVYASDYSGNNNIASYNADFAENGYSMPLVSGGKYGTRITDANSISLPVKMGTFGITTIDPIANQYASDNDFSIEAWIYPRIITSSETTILADISNNIGLYWENGRVIFKVSSTESVGYIPEYTNKSIHIVGIYSVSSISISIDGSIVATKSLSNFKFSNSSLNLQIGPTANAQDSFIVDAPAIYRYSLNNNQIYKHYYAGNISSSPIQVVEPDNGILFSCPDASVKAPFAYSYPESRQWTEFIDSNTYYDPTGGYISFYKTDTSQSKTFIIEDEFAIPSQIGLNSSKIEWRGDYGIVVESSSNGVDYVQCVNGSSLPQFNKTSFSTAGKVWIRITMSTSDASKYLPRLSMFNIRFYNNKDIYADNYGDKISSVSEYDMGTLNYPPYSRHGMNGIRPKSGTGFDLSTISSIKTIEMFFTPKDLAATTLLYSLGSGGYSTTRFAWNSSGVLTKTNISAVYINGVLNTSMTNIWDIMEPEEPLHIILVLTNPASNTIQFNYETTGGLDHLYNNIAIYSKVLSEADSVSHYNLYVGRTLSEVVEPVITLTEQEPVYYNNDWVVIQTA